MPVYRKFPFSNRLDNQSVCQIARQARKSRLTMLIGESRLRRAADMYFKVEYIRYWDEKYQESCPSHQQQFHIHV